MQDKTEKKKSKIIKVGMDLVRIIEKIKEKFEEEYSFKPNNIVITNLIAKRYIEAGLL